jgi:ABC-2 type transport system permease protein
MSWRRSAAVARHDLRILRRDPFPYIVGIFMPLVLMAFIRPAFRQVVQDRAPGANGAEQAVPGMTVMFAFFLIGTVGFAFFREHGWATWDRLRASAATPTELMAGKVVPALLMLGVQLGTLFGLGALLFGLEVRGEIAGLLLVSASLALALVALGLAMVAICRTVVQFNAFANLGALVFAGLGGALTPVTALPDWARAIAPATPSYWAMEGYTDVILGGAGVSDVLRPVAVLLSFAAAFTIVAAWRFRFDEAKTTWA